MDWQLIDITNPCALLVSAGSVALFLSLSKIDVHIKKVIVVTNIKAQIYKKGNLFDLNTESVLQQCLHFFVGPAGHC